MPFVVGLCPHCGVALQVNLFVPRALCAECRQPFSCAKAFELEIATRGFAVRHGVLQEYQGGELDIQLPFGLKGIGQTVFRGMAITTVTIPATVETIGAWAFEDCHQLQTVELPPSLTTLGQSAFESCAALTAITLSAALTEIPDRAFANCTALSVIDLPAQVTRIGDRAFAGCTTLRRVRLPEAIDSIGLGAFQGCRSLTTVDLPDQAATRLGPVFSGTPWGESWNTRRMSTQSQRWAASGRCQHCGDTLRGVLIKRCVRCGRSG